MNKKKFYASIDRVYSHFSKMSDDDFNVIIAKADLGKYGKMILETGMLEINEMQYNLFSESESLLMSGTLSFEDAECCINYSNGDYQLSSTPVIIKGSVDLTYVSSRYKYDEDFEWAA